MKNLKEKNFIKFIPKYIGGESIIKGKSGVIKLSANENPYGPSEKAIKVYKNISTNLAQYPDSSHLILKKTISSLFDINIQNIICGAGSDEIINLICHCFIGENDEAIHTEHGFAMYKISTLSYGGKPVSVKENYRITSVQNIIAACNKKTKIIFLANPNNPTGTMISEDELNFLISNVSKNILIVLDGAYAEYVDDYDGGINLVKNNENVIMLRTFSKIYGLGSLRVGWAFANQNIINVLMKIRSPFNLSSSGLNVASVAMQDQEYLNDCKIKNNNLRDWLTLELRKLNIEIDNSFANFILARFRSKETSSMVDEYFKINGILVRNVENYNIKNGLRITIGDKNACQKIKALLFSIKDKL